EEVKPIIEAPLEEPITAAAVQEPSESVAVDEAPPDQTSETEVAESEESSVEASEETEESEETAEEIKIETAPADFRFPTTNQTRHCFTRYIEYHRCVAAKGDEAPECQKFAKYYRSLCPGEWVEKWNEQRENGTFPGPL
ncbi:hypothetical protein M569_15568, partial [Genlisea aurea]